MPGGPSAEVADLVDQIKQNAMVIWPGQGRNFEVRILRTPDGSSISAVLVEVGLAKGAPRTMSGFYNTEREAVEDVDRQLSYMVEEKNLLAEGAAQR